METSTVVNSDGTVPADIRELYGIEAGAKVHCVMNGYQLEMRIIGTKLPRQHASSEKFSRNDQVARWGNS